MPLFFGHFVVAVLLAAYVHLRAREPGVRVHVERRERVGNRRGGDVRGFGVCRLRGHRLRFGFFRGCLHCHLPRPNGIMPLRCGKEYHAPIGRSDRLHGFPTTK